MQRGGQDTDEKTKDLGQEKGQKVKNVEKRREARERGKTECGKPKKTGGRQSRRGEGSRKESEINLRRERGSQEDIRAR